MEQDKKKSKDRIFRAAVSLFARKGFAAVGIREISREANVNVSMINYYFGSKVGILKAIVNECYDRYYHAISELGNDVKSPDDRVRRIVHNLVDFFRNNTEMAMVAFNSLPIDIPEIVDLKMEWVSGHREVVDSLFGDLGLDAADDTQMGVVRGSLSAIILAHFQGRYAWDHMLEAPKQSRRTREYLKYTKLPKFNDAFYRDYSRSLADFYLKGLTTLTGGKASRSKTRGSRRAKPERR